MSKQNNVALLGGSFDPPHLGHMAILNTLNNIDWLHKIIVMPAYQSPFKTETSAPPNHRVEMLKRCINSLINIKEIKISEYEIKQEKPVVTIDTLTHLRTKNPQNHYYLVIGSDHLFQFKKWARFTDILSQHNLIIINRNNTTTRTLQDYISSKFTQEQQTHIQIVMMPENKCASSKIRQTKSYNTNCPTSVRTYIEKHKLYQ